MSGLHPTKIQWATHSVNPVFAVDRARGKRGWACTKIATGCQHCYAEALNRDRFGTGLPYDVRSESLAEWRMDAGALQSALGRRKAATIFWCDMTDMFHARVPDEWVDQCFAVMALTPQLRHVVLTKRPEAMRGWLAAPDVDARVEAAADELAGARGWCHSGDWRWPLPNVALGVSVSNQDDADELIPQLLVTPAALRFVSYEPATGPVDFQINPAHRCYCGEIRMNCDCKSVDAIIIGGESGRDARPFALAWARNTVAQCRAAGVVAMVKQLGANVTGLPLVTLRRTGTNHRGDPAEWPDDLQPYAASVDRWPWGAS